MLIKRDFDQLKEILSDPKKAEGLIAYNGPTLEVFKYKKVDIKNITEDEITGTYTHGKYQYVIKFLRAKDNYIEYIIETSSLSYWMLLIFILFVLYKNQDLGAIQVGGIMFLLLYLIIYLVNNQIKVGIYNRISKGWDEFTQAN